MTRSQYDMYQQAQQNHSEIDQLLMLYDGAINFIRQSVKAIEDKDYETRWNLINRTCAIINGLHECLDFEKGGETAQALSEFYYSIDMRLVSVHHSNDIKLCETIIEELSGMRNAWRDVAADMQGGSQNSENNQVVTASTENSNTSLPSSIQLNT